MADLTAIQAEFEAGNIKYSAHALQRATERHISRAEIDQAVSKGEVIEDYPVDKYGPSCLLYGVTEAERVLHIQVSYPPNVKIITVYEPNPDEWENNRIRKTT